MKSLSQIVDLAIDSLRGGYFSLRSPLHFKRVGKNFKLYGAQYMSGRGISLGDNCYFHAVDLYKGSSYSPNLEIGEGCMFSNNVHISLVNSISIGRDCLLGSNIYIGDHSHGSTNPKRFDAKVPPAQRPLDDIGEIIIGANVWVGDGAVILAGMRIPDGCIIGANSVVKGSFAKCSVIAGAPAKSVKEL